MNEQRDRVLRLVREHDGAVDAHDLASITGLHVTTVRFHLDALCHDGLVSRTTMNRSSVGRPRTGYLPVVERMDYRMLAEVLAMELGDTAARRARRAEHAGRQWAGRVEDSRRAAAVGAERQTEGGDALDRATSLAGEVFERMGFAPQLVAPSQPGERTVALRACPIRELARVHPEVGCAVHLGLLRGLLVNVVGTGRRSQTRQPRLSARLEPFVEPELCLAKVIRDD